MKECLVRTGVRLWCHTPSLPVTWPWSCCPCSSHSLKPGWRRFTVNRWKGLKEDTSAVAVGGGGDDFEMRCIDQNRTYSGGRTWQHRSHCSTVPVLCQTTHFFFFFCCVYLSSQWNLYDPSSHPHKQFLSTHPSVLPILILRAPHLLVCCVSHHPSLTAPFSPLPQTCTHRVSSNLALCPWVHTVTKAYCSSFFGHCILSLKPLFLFEKKDVISKQ